MRISGWSSEVCSSDLRRGLDPVKRFQHVAITLGIGDPARSLGRAGQVAHFADRRVNPACLQEHARAFEPSLGLRRGRVLAPDHEKLAELALESVPRYALVARFELGPKRPKPG